MTDPAVPPQTQSMEGSLAAPGLMRAAADGAVAAATRPQAGASQKDAATNAAADAAANAVLFGALYKAHFAYVWRSLARLGIRDADLPDLAHDVFVVVHRKLDGYDASRPPKPWLFGICFRVALDKKRRHASFKEVLGTDAPERSHSPAPSPEAVASAREAHDLVMRALDALDFDKRAVFVLCDLEGMSVPEVAQVIDAPVNTLYSRLRLARAAFTAEVRRLQGGRDG